MIYTMRIYLTGGVIIDKLSRSADKEAHLQEYLGRGVRTTDGSCLVIYPARMIERIECYGADNPPPKLKEKRKNAAPRAARKSSGEAKRDIPQPDG